MDSIETIILQVEIQANGIIRNEKGRLIARLIDSIDFNGEHIKEMRHHIKINTMNTKQWSEEFERIMPKNSGETMSYPQFCAVRNFISSLLAQQAKEIEEMLDVVIENAENVALLSSEETTANNIKNNIIKPLLAIRKVTEKQ